MKTNFQAGTFIMVNGRQFDIDKAQPCPYFEGSQELVGTKHGDPTFLKGKRTLNTAYLTDAKTPGWYYYDWNAK